VPFSILIIMSKNRRFKPDDFKKNSKNSVPAHSHSGHSHDHVHSDHVYPVGSEIKLTAEEQAALVKLNEDMAAEKNLIYDLSMQIHKLETDLNAALSKANNSQTELFTKATAIARAKGIDIDDPAKGKWNLDITKMVFTKLS
jgi:hypothetical protein